MVPRAQVGRALAALALAWGVLVLAAALWVPITAGIGQRCTTTTGGGSQCRTYEPPGQTLVEQGGTWALVLVALAVVAPLLVLMLLGAHVRGRNWARGLVWAVILLLGLYVIFTGFSMGIWLLPTAGTLVIAASLAEAKV